MSGGRHNTTLRHVEASIKHHVVGILFISITSLVFFLSSSTTKQIISYGADKPHRFSIVDKPLRGIDVNTAWLRDGRQIGTCLALPEDITTKRVGFPFYYQKHTEYYPCGQPLREFNVLAFFLDCLVVCSVGIMAGALVHYKHKKT